MKKQVIRLTESDLHHIIRESVNQVMIEEGFFSNIGKGISNGLKNLGANSLLVKYNALYQQALKSGDNNLAEKYLSQINQLQQYNKGGLMGGLGKLSGYKNYAYEVGKSIGTNPQTSLQSKQQEAQELRDKIDKLKKAQANTNLTQEQRRSNQEYIVALNAKLASVNKSIADLNAYINQKTNN